MGAWSPNRQNVMNLAEQCGNHRLLACFSPVPSSNILLASLLSLRLCKLLTETVGTARLKQGLISSLGKVELNYFSAAGDTRPDLRPETNVWDTGRSNSVTPHHSLRSAWPMVATSHVSQHWSPGTLVILVITSGSVSDRDKCHPHHPPHHQQH